MNKLWLLLSHGAALGVGFAGGIYALPIIVAPASPALADIQAEAARAAFKTRFRRDLEGSDLLHWGEGAVSVSRAAVTLEGRLAPGPDYKLYLSPEFVQTEAQFLQLKSRMVRIGDVKTFDNFRVAMPASVDPAQFNTVVVWCETFGQFISAGQYR